MYRIFVEGLVMVDYPSYPWDSSGIFHLVAQAGLCPKERSPSTHMACKWFWWWGDEMRSHPPPPPPPCFSLAFFPPKNSNKNKEEDEAVKKTKDEERRGGRWRHLMNKKKRREREKPCSLLRPVRPSAKRESLFTDNVSLLLFLLWEEERKTKAKERDCALRGKLLPVSLPGKCMGR